MKTIANKLAKFGQGLTTLANCGTLSLSAVAAFALFLMTIFVSFDILARALFNAPTKWVDEISGYLMAIVVFFGLAHTQKVKSHIRVDVLIERMSTRFQDWAYLLANLVFLLYSIILLYLTTKDLIQSLKFKTTSGTAIDIPVAPWQTPYPIGLAMLSFLLLLNIHAGAKKIMRGNSRERSSDENGSFRPD